MFSYIIKTSLKYPLINFGEFLLIKMTESFQKKTSCILNYLSFRNCRVVNTVIIFFLAFTVSCFDIALENLVLLGRTLEILIIKSYFVILKCSIKNVIIPRQSFAGIGPALILNSSNLLLFLQITKSRSSSFCTNLSIYVGHAKYFKKMLYDSM